MVKILPSAMLAICLSFLGCKDSSKIIRLISLTKIPSLRSKKRKALMLVVEIDEDGRLRLNKIETGTTDDVSELKDVNKIKIQ
jgi:hypothetical protein